MKRTFALCTLALLVIVSCNRAPKNVFDKYFTNGTMRIDYFHTGDAKSETVKIDQVYSYDSWAGSLVNLLDTINFGAYYYKIYDKASQELIYSKGFDSYFKEYQFSTPAIEGQVKQFQESAIIPFPRSEIEFALEKRDKLGQLHEIFRTPIAPDQAVKAPFDPGIKVYTTLDNGDPHVKADIAFVGEGYTAAEEQKFKDDLERCTEIFFRAEPCKSYKSSFNIRGVLRYSEDSGVDEPRAGIDKNTAVNATFNSMGSERYLLTEDNKDLRDIAGHVPYDALYIMVNSSRYGGGGIYNFYCVFTSDNINSDYLMVHEFGHSFFGLADEYYTSSTAYNDFYPPGYEPVEPNITALNDPEHLKWKKLVTPGTEIPTPWNKAAYDSLDLKWQKRRAMLNDEIAMLQKNHAPEEKVKAAKENYNRESTEHDSIMTSFLDHSKYAGKVGAFEGAGYMSEGMYRPTLNCIMFSRVHYFCPVCQDAMIKVIKFYSE